MASHHFLLEKPKKFEVGGKLLTLLHSYLEDRQQHVKIYDDCSDYLDVTSGAPQGSILGSLLFLFFINGLPNITPEDRQQRDKRIEKRDQQRDKRRHDRRETNGIGSRNHPHRNVMQGKPNEAQYLKMQVTESKRSTFSKSNQN